MADLAMAEEGTSMMQRLVETLLLLLLLETVQKLPLIVHPTPRSGAWRANTFTVSSVRQRMLKFVSSLLGLALFAAVSAIALLLMAQEPTPLVAAGPGASAEEARWFQTLEKGDAQFGEDAEQWRRLDLTPRQLDVVADLAAQRIGDGHARVLLNDGSAELLASFPIPWQRGGHANLRLGLRQTDSVPEVTAATVGGIALPARVVQRLAQRGLASLAGADLLQQVSLRTDGARVTYRRPPGALDAVGTGMLGDSDQRRLLRRQTELADIIGNQPRAGRLNLAALLSALLARGDDASAPGVDAIADNRAALLVLAAYVNGRQLALPPQTTSATAQTASARPRPVELFGRRDLAEHFMASAAMAAEGGSALSHLVGLVKELRDAEGGSGFSFADLSANRAGIRFAEAATGSAASARHVQRLARVGLAQNAIMPAIDGLPEGMQRAELERAVGDVGGPDYERVRSYIDRRIDNLSLHRSVPSD